MPQRSLANKVFRRFAGLGMSCVQKIRIALYRFISTCKVDGNPILIQPLQTAGLGTIRFSGVVKIGVFPSPYYFSTYAYLEVRNSSAKITIGADTWINNNFCAIAEHTSIKIGQSVLIDTGVEIFDSDFHGIRVDDRRLSRAEWAKQVVIEDDVFIGSNVRVLKGVTIGRGSVIANGAVVASNIPSAVIAGGNPARVLKVIG